MHELFKYLEGVEWFISPSGKNLYIYTMMEKRGKNPHYNIIATIHKYAYGYTINY